MERPVFKPIGTPSEELDTPGPGCGPGRGRVQHHDRSPSSPGRRLQGASQVGRASVSRNRPHAGWGRRHVGRGGIYCRPGRGLQPTWLRRHPDCQRSRYSVEDRPRRVPGKADHSHSRDRQRPQYRRPQRGGGQPGYPVWRGCVDPRLRGFYRCVAA